MGENDAEASVPNFPAKAPDANELRAREREMHRAQMREEEARQREESAVREEPRQEPVRQEPAYAEPAPVQAPARIDPKQILESAGLQMVETDSTKVRRLPVEPEPVQMGRPRRERPAEPQPGAEELVQVETRNK